MGDPARAEIQGDHGLAIAIRRITFGADLGNVQVPAVLVTGTEDQRSPQEISEDALAEIASADKALVSIPGATHRTFDSTFCAQTRAAGAIAQGDPDAILDRHTFESYMTTPISGTPLEFCPYDAFREPVDIRCSVTALTGFRVTPRNVPTTGLESDAVKRQVRDIAVEFFSRVL